MDLGRSPPKETTAESPLHLANSEDVVIARARQTKRVGDAFAMLVGALATILITTATVVTAINSTRTADEQKRTSDIAQRELDLKLEKQERVQRAALHLLRPRFHSLTARQARLLHRRERFAAKASFALMMACTCPGSAWRSYWLNKYHRVQRERLHTARELVRTKRSLRMIRHRAEVAGVTLKELRTVRSTNA